MKKKVFYIVTLVVFIALTCTVAMASRAAYQGEAIANKIGTTINKYVSDLLAKDKGMIPSENNIFAVVLDEEIPQSYFNVRVALYKSIGSETPELDAWESIKLEAAEKKFAKEHGLLPTDEEIIVFSQDMKEEIESTEESYAIGKTLIESAGMTWDQYWNEYKPTYETPAHLIKINIAEYLAENNIEGPDVSSIEYEILNKEYQEIVFL